MTRQECEHGQLKRSCQMCDLVEERDELRKLAYIGEHMHEDYSWKARFAELKAERDALAAHVERLDTPATVFIENVDEVIEMLRAMGDASNIVALTEDLSDAADSLAAALNGTPTTPLARLKAQWQAEALDELASDLALNANNARENGYAAAADTMQDAADYALAKAELRRQAGGDV